MGDGFNRSKDPSNSIKVLKGNLERKTTQRTQRKQQIIRYGTHIIMRYDNTYGTYAYTDKTVNKYNIQV